MKQGSYSKLMLVRPAQSARTKWPAATAAAFGAAMTCATHASFQSWVDRNAWRAAVGTPTTYRSASTLISGQSVDPELWANVGVHLECGAPLTVVYDSGPGNAITSPVGASFDVIFDQPRTALYSRIGPSSGFLTYWHGERYVGYHGFGASGQIGVISTEPFDRIRISDGQWYGYLWNLEWGQPVPGPAGFMLFAFGGIASFGRRRVPC